MTTTHDKTTGCTACPQEWATTGRVAEEECHPQEVEVPIVLVARLSWTLLLSLSYILAQLKEARAHHIDPRTVATLQTGDMGNPLIAHMALLHMDQDQAVVSTTQDLLPGTGTVAHLPAEVVTGGEVSLPVDPLRLVS